MKKLLVVIFGLIALAVAIAALAVYSSGRRAAVPLSGDLVLRLVLDRPLADYDPAPELPFLARSGGPSLIEVYQALQSARHDARVKALVVYIQQASFGLAQAEELRRQIAAVATAGKPVQCYLETAGEGSNGTLAYYIATACPKIGLAPAGELNVVGLFLDSRFLRGTLDKLKIEAEFEHVGAYKSAGEGYTEFEHSPAAREALSSLLDDFYAQLVFDMAAGRGVAEGQIRQAIDGAPYAAAEALERGLVDALLYPDEVEAELRRELGEDWRWVDVGAYAPVGHGLGRSKIALVFAQGTIVRGPGGIDPWTGERFIGSDGFGAVLEELIEDDSVAAVILRVDSPGGSAQASDLLLRQVERLAASKPVVVSMSSLAASGGYYISSKAQRIVAEATSLTGSIGVVAGRFVTGRFEQELLGISHDSLQRGANADYFSSQAPLAPPQRERFLALMTSVYDTFVDHVADGRGMPREAVEAVAQGRIWSGRRAHDLGLVDEIGGLDAARRAAAEAAGLQVGETRLVLYPKPPSLFEFLSGRSSGGLFAAWLRDRLAGSLRAPLALEEEPAIRRLGRPF